MRDRLIAADYRILHDRHDALALRRGLFEDQVVQSFSDRISASRALA